MKSNLLLYVFFVSSLFLFSSCFDVVEEVDIKPDGSGKIKLTVNLSKSKTKVASLMKLDKIDGIKIPSEKEIRSEVNNITAILKSSKGISNVHSSLDFTNYIATLSCDFTNISALNNFTKTLSTQFKTQITDYSLYAFNPQTKVLSRSSKYSSKGKKELEKLKAENQKSLQEAYFTSIFRFDNPIGKQNNPHAKISANKKAVMLKANVPDIVNGKINLSNSINLN